MACQSCRAYLRPRQTNILTNTTEWTTEAANPAALNLRLCSTASSGSIRLCITSRKPVTTNLLVTNYSTN